MPDTMPLRIDTDLVEAAKTVGGRQHRNATQQLTHWANLGRELEGSTVLSVAAIQDTLAGRRRYDDLPTPEDKAAVRAEWTTKLDDLADGFDLTEQFEAKGIATWVDIAPDGTLIHHHA